MASPKTLQALERRWERSQERLVLQSADLSLGTLSQMVGSGQIDIEPRYQRRERWDAERQSALIESFLLNIPVPPIYLSEEKIGHFSVIDGKQRLTAIHRFLTGDLSLHKLEKFREADGLSIGDLPIGVTGNLEVRPLRAVTLLRQSDPDLKYEVFTRLNRNGQPLAPQEIRNVLYRGALNDLIFELSGAPFLHRQMKITGVQNERYKKMEDVELVLRFLTLRESWDDFSGDYRRSMDDFMAHHQNDRGSKLTEMAKAFNTALSRCEALWGDKAFRRPKDVGWRDQDLAGLYDAEMLAALSVTASEVKRLDTKQVQAATRRLFEDADFEDAVRLQTNTPKKVALRVRKMSELLSGLAG